MPTWLSVSAVSAIVAILAGCSDPGLLAQRTTRPKPAAADSPADDEEATPGPGDEAPGEEGDRGPLGVVTIDVQQVFFETAGRRNPAIDVAARMARTAHVFQLAETKRVPLFVTYEASKTGDHALPPSLAAALPAGALEIVKTTFAATGQAQFLPAIQASGARRLLVLGAETDVCVLQTVLGLRRAGYEVIAVVDALVTEEVNAAPALRRMRQAGVVQLGVTEAEKLLANGGSSPRPPASSPPVIVRPLEMGILLHDLEGLGAADSNSAAKLVRLRELLLISEWFRLPLLAADPAAALAALPPTLRKIVTRPIVALAARPANVRQLAIAGGRAGIDEAVAGLAGKVDAFLVEDALLGAAPADLEPLYVGGAVPTTYKTLYYELTQSVADAEWPSQQWVTDGAARYYDMTMAPEELPPAPVP